MLDRLPKVCAFIPNSEVVGGFIGILTTDPTSPRLPPSLPPSPRLRRSRKLRRTRRRTGDTDFHGYKDTPNRFENVSITRSSSVPFREIRGSISEFGFSVPACEPRIRNCSVRMRIRCDKLAVGRITIPRSGSWPSVARFLEWPPQRG